jgi:hypothetical protein
MTLAHAKAQVNPRSFRSGSSQRARKEARNCGSALPVPSTPSAPLALGLCSSRASSLDFEKIYRGGTAFFWMRYRGISAIECQERL